MAFIFCIFVLLSFSAVLRLQFKGYLGSRTRSEVCVLTRRAVLR